MAALTDIKGVGPSRVARLEGAGYGTLEALAAADAAEVRAALGAGVNLDAAEAMVAAARELAPPPPTAAEEPSADASGPCDVIDRIAERIGGSGKARKRAIREVGAQLARRLAKPLRQELGKKAPSAKRLRKALAAAIVKELRKA